MQSRRTQVCIIGSGPSGLLLSQLLDNHGIDSIVLERQTREHVEGRIRAGVLEWGTVEALEEAGIGDCVHKYGLPHGGFELRFDDDQFRIDLKGLTGKSVMVYGQTELTKDLISKRVEQGAEIIFSAADVRPVDITSQQPAVRYSIDGVEHEIRCDQIAGCDGFHGVARQSIPPEEIVTSEKIYPFGWLGLLVDRPPVADELIYANHKRGFALCSMRSPTRSRYYVQCPLSDDVAEWSDQRFWEELAIRIGETNASNLQTGQSIEKSIAPLRSFVAENMRYGNLFLCGDAAHIVPPTGAKGLNLAVADVRVLARALCEFHKNGNTEYLDRYANICLKRVWKVERFSWFMSTLLHQFPETNRFEKQMQRAEFEYIKDSESAARSLAENYVGLPLEM